MIAKGVTTIVWGTIPFSNSGTNFAGAIVKSVKATERTESIKIENGSGLTAAHVMLLDGMNWEFTCIDDSNTANITWPIAGQDNVTLQVPIMGINGVSSSGTATAQVINNDYNAARKVEGERVILCSSFTLIPSI